ncbi:MAG: CDP-glucose 4,6-dehydratase [Patescibacteria group bacterium]
MENLQPFFQGKKILITGHTGFKGSWLSQILVHWRAQVSGIALVPHTNPNLFEILEIQPNIHNYFADIRDQRAVHEIIQKERPEIIFHLAAQPLVRESYLNPLYTFETNILGTANVLQAAKDVGSAKVIVLVTTDKVYEIKEDPTSAYREHDQLGGYDPYSASKAGAEMVISSYLRSFFHPKDYSLKHETLIASVRSGNVIGGGDWSKDRIIPDIIRSVFEKYEPVILRNPSSVRPWQHVMEPLLGYLVLAKYLYEGKKECAGAWNFGPQEENYITVQELTEELLGFLKKSGFYRIDQDTQEPHEAESLKLDVHHAQEMLRWHSRFSLRTCLEMTVEWYQRFYDRGDMIEITNRHISSLFETP